MKKSFLVIFSLTIVFSLMAFGYFSWNGNVPNLKNTPSDESIHPYIDLLDFSGETKEMDFVYNVDSRYIYTITKEKLHNAKTIIDILPEKATQSIESYHYVRISFLEDSQEVDGGAIGETEVLNYAQIQLLRTAEYSTNFYIRSDYKIKNEYTGALEDQYLTYFITIVPEKEAEYSEGKEALISYIRENSKEKTSTINRDQLKAGKVNFTVSKEGKISSVELSSTSGHNAVDDALVELITSMPGKWNAATNSLGEKVDQEFVFFFGMQGC